MLFSFIRFVLLMFGWTKNRYFTSNLWIGNPLGAIKDIHISAKSFGRTHHTTFSDPINSAWRTYSQSSNYDKQSVKPSSYREQKLTQWFIFLFLPNSSYLVPKVKNVHPTDFRVEKLTSLFTERNLDNTDLWSMRSSFKTIKFMVNFLFVLFIFPFNLFMYIQQIFWYAKK